MFDPRRRGPEARPLTECAAELEQDDKTKQSADPCRRGRESAYGDSLVSESVAELESRLHSTFPGWNVIIHAWGGLAQCDEHWNMAYEADHNNVRVAILAFVGNAGSRCNVGRPYPDSYVTDANWAADLYTSRGIPLAFVAAPGRAGTTPAQRVVPNVYRSVGASRGISVIDYDDLFVDPTTGRYEQYGPCLVGECTGFINLRAPDGGHLCVVPSVPCAVYSSGVIRYVDRIIQMAAVLGGVAAASPRVMVPTTTTTTTTTSPTTTTTTSPTTITTTGASATDAPPGATVVEPRIRPPYAPFGDAPPPAGIDTRVFRR